MNGEVNKIIFILLSWFLGNAIESKPDTEISSEDIKQIDKFMPVYSNPPKAAIYNTFLIASKCIKENVPGDFVECGVAAGAQIAAIAYACHKNLDFRKIHLFDSFEGIPLAGPNDTQQPGITGPIQHNTNVKDLNTLLVSSGIAAHSVEEVINNMKLWNIDTKNFIFHKGWFQHTLPKDESSIEKIAFLRLDGDLYESTKICLEYLYQKISKGGYIVIDDYILTGCKKAVDEYLAKYNLNPTIIPVAENGPVFWQIQ